MDETTAVIKCPKCDLLYIGDPSDCAWCDWVGTIRKAGVV